MTSLAAVMSKPVSRVSLGTARLELNRLLEAKTAREYPRLTAAERNRVAQYAYAIFDQDIGQQVRNRLAKAIQDYRDFVARQPNKGIVVFRQWFYRQFLVLAGLLGRDKKSRLQHWRGQRWLPGKQEDKRLGGVLLLARTARSAMPIPIAPPQLCAI